MELKEARVIDSKSGLKVVLPMTQPTGKVRIKERSFFGDYGNPIAARQVALGLSNYVEWQIGYDLEAKSENSPKTTLGAYPFCNYKGIKKWPYELSEILFYSYQHKLITADEIKVAFSDIKSLDDASTFEEMEDMNISRTNPLPAKVNGMDFFKMIVKYPMLVHKFGKYDIYAEVVIKEKQRAVGTQAMLYVCIPITTLVFRQNAIGRVLDAKECADWLIGKEEAHLAIELFRVFGMLSPKHRHDVLAIFSTIFKGSVHSPK